MVSEPVPQPSHDEQALNRVAGDVKPLLRLRPTPAYYLGTHARSRMVFVGREVLKTARTGIPMRGLPSFR